MKPELKKIKIDCFIVPNKITERGIWFIDYPWDVMGEYYDKVGKSWTDENFILVDLHLDNQNNIVLKNSSIELQHNIDKRNKIKCYNALTQLFGSKFKWDKTQNGTMKLSLK